MSPKARPKIPKSKRMAEKTRRMVKALWADVRGKPVRKTKPNPWQRCVQCSRRNPPTDYVCGKPTHRQLCRGCCGYPHDEDEDERGWEFADGELDEGREDAE